MMLLDNAVSIAGYPDGRHDRRWKKVSGIDEPEWRFLSGLIQRRARIFSGRFWLCLSDRGEEALLDMTGFHLCF